MSATLILRDRQYEVKSGTTLRSALEKLSISPQAVLPTRQGELLTDDEIIQEGDVIKLVAVVSGGSG